MHYMGINVRVSHRELNLGDSWAWTQPSDVAQGERNAGSGAPFTAFKGEAFLQWLTLDGNARRLWWSRAVAHLLFSDHEDVFMWIMLGTTNQFFLSFFFMCIVVRCRRTSLDDLLLSMEPLQDYLANAGCLRPLTCIEDKDLLVQDVLMFQVVHRVWGAFERFVFLILWALFLWI